MKRYYNILIVIIILLMGSSFLTAQDNCSGACTDNAAVDWTVATNVGGYTNCEEYENDIGCTQDLFGIDVSVDCQCTCNLCPGVCGDGVQSWDETWENCPEDIPGCELEKESISLMADGRVLFNTDNDINGFEFYLNGGTLNGGEAASGGEAEATIFSDGSPGGGLTMSTNQNYQPPECPDSPLCGEGKILGASFDGSSIPAQCGTLVVLDFTGTPNRLHTFIISDPFGEALPFTYQYPPGSVFGCMDGGTTEYGPTGIYTDENLVTWSCSCETLEFISNEGIAPYCDCFGSTGDGNTACNYVDNAIAEYDPLADEYYPCEYAGSANYTGCDCEGNTLDCANVCGGSAIFDECGKCGGTGPSDGYDCFGNCPTCVEDCFGVVSGGGKVDNCYQCIDCSSRCVDADGNILPINNKDECDELADGAIWYDYTDCTGHPAWNATCTDCNEEVWGSAFIDACEVCVGGNTAEDKNGNGELDDGACTDAELLDCADVDVGCDANADSNYDCYDVEEDINLNNSLDSPIPACYKNCNGQPIGPPPIPWSYDNCGLVCLEEGTCAYNTITDATACGETEGATWIDNSCIDDTITSETACDNTADAIWTQTNSDCGDYCDNNPANNCQVDCNGDWGGFAVIDNCGFCVLGASGRQPCVPDCAGDWGGFAVIDECGICDDNPSNDGPIGSCSGDADCYDYSDWESCVSEIDAYDCEWIGDCDCFGNVGDCNNECGGSATYDCTYNPDDSSTWADACNGKAYWDICGVCDIDSTNDCIADCEGVWGGPLINTCFGYDFDDNAETKNHNEANCEASDTNDNGEVDDHNQENCEAGGGFWSPFGFDECGVCDGSGIPAGDCNCFGHVKDECGGCNGNRYFTDSNGESCTILADIDTVEECIVYNGFWTAESEICINIPDFDCFYRSAGKDYCGCPLIPDDPENSPDLELDDCGACGGTGAAVFDPVWGTLATNECCEWELDECGVCLGPGKVYECGCTAIPDNYCDCDGTLEIDCAGVCGGSSATDECGTCLQPNCVAGNYPANFDSSFNPCDSGYTPSNLQWNTTCLDCNGIFNGPTQYDCTYDPEVPSTWESACGGNGVYDCRYGNADYDQSESAVVGYCGAIDTTGTTLPGSLLNTGAIKGCYGYNNNGAWVEKTTEDAFDTEDECKFEGYVWINVGNDVCGICNGEGQNYGSDLNCCEADLDECFVCGAEVGDMGPGLADSGDCVGDDGCEVLNNNKIGCKSSTDGSCSGDVGCEAYNNLETDCRSGGASSLNCVWDKLTCYWGAWDDCSGDQIKDCKGKAPTHPDYIGNQGIFGYDACGECDGEGAIYGTTENCCEDYVDKCGACHEGDCSGDVGCSDIGNEAGCINDEDLNCSWIFSAYSDPATENPSWNSSGFASPSGEEEDGYLYCDCFGNIEDCWTTCGDNEDSIINTGVYECVGGGGIYDNKEECVSNGKCSGDFGCETLIGEDTNLNGVLDDGVCTDAELLICTNDNILDADCGCHDFEEDTNLNGVLDSDSDVCDSEEDDLICNWNYFPWKKIGNDCTDEFGNSNCGGTNYTCFACGDDDAALGSSLSSCSEAVATFGCDQDWGSAGTLENICPVSCGHVCEFDNHGNECIKEDIDVCGLCYGVGVTGSNCDCSGNEGNCAGICPTNYVVDGNIVEDISTITGNPGIWIWNDDYNAINGDDQDGDGICDPSVTDDGDDDCVSSGAPHLIFMADKSMTDTYYPSVCQDVCIGPDGEYISPGANKIVCQGSGGIWHDENYALTDSLCLAYSGADGGSGLWIPARPNSFYGGYDLCGNCNGDGFSCDFESAGGFKEINLSWNRPNMGGLEDSLGEDLMGELGLLYGLNLNNDTDMNSTFYRNSTDEAFDPDAICSEPPNFMTDDTTIVEYGLFSSLSPPIKIQFCDDDSENYDCINYDPNDPSKGTLDIYMTNLPACSYCEDPIYNNNNFPWVAQREACEISWGGNSTWIVNTEMTRTECENVPSFSETGGWWFDGNVGGFQFYVKGMKITSLGTAGSAPSTFNLLQLNDNADCDADGIADEGCNLIMAASMLGMSVEPHTNELLLSIEFADFNASGICFAGTETLAYGTWSPPIASDTNGDAVLVEWSSCSCDQENSPPDECGVCGGIGIDQECGCGEPTKCEFQEGKCDCTGRVPSATYEDNTYICWDEAEVCSAAECTPDPNAVSYNVYREDALGDTILRASGLSAPHYTDANLGYEEEYCYLVSYFQDENQNEKFDADEEYFIELELGNEVCGTTEALIEGCTYSSSCEPDENANYYDGSCWWKNLDCECEAGQGAVADMCGTCDNDFTNDCTADCLGEWGGTAVEDGCGVCMGDGTTCCPEGTIADNCSTCDNDPLNDCVPDCNGDWGGEAADDNCGVCSGGESGHVANSDQDLCGVCFGENLPNTGTCDCGGSPNGDNLEDECGTCDADPSNNCLEDCNGIWGGSLLGFGTFECYSIGGDSITTAIDSTACLSTNDSLNIYTLWTNIGNDDCGVCDGFGPVNGVGEYDCDGNLAIMNGLIPEEYNINNIYPNPFNPVTNIKFGLPENANVKIIVYDIKGRQVTTLVNSFQFAGYYSISWNANSKSSGVYFIRMMTDTFNQTKKVILMK